MVYGAHLSVTLQRITSGKLDATNQETECVTSKVIIDNYSDYADYSDDTDDGPVLSPLLLMALCSNLKKGGERANSQKNVVCSF